MPVEIEENICRALLAEWDHVGRSRRAVAALRRWAEIEPSLRPFPTPCDVVKRCQARDNVRASNELVGALLRVAADPLAARTLLQALLPSITARAFRAARLAGQADRRSVADWNQEMAMHVLDRIGTLAGTSPTWPAVAIVESAWWPVERLAEAERRTRASAVPVESFPDTAAAPERTAAEELVDVLVDAVNDGHIPARAAAVVFTTRVWGHGFDQVAAWDGRAFEAVRKVRFRAEAALVAAHRCP